MTHETDCSFVPHEGGMLPCEHCHKLFKAEIRKRGVRQRFCSPACAYAARNVPNRVCLCCNTPFHARPSAKQVYCSAECRKKMTAPPSREITCEACLQVFVGTFKQGAWPRFCNRTCFLSVCVRAETIPCEYCETMFLSKAVNGKLARFCSVACKAAASVTSIDFVCPQCNAPFTRWPAQLRELKTDVELCCSRECTTQYSVGSRSTAWKGGQYVSAERGLMERVERPDRASNYDAHHRIVAMKAIGRLLRRGEVVIFVNGDSTDVKESNLFICASRSEYARRQMGSLPWPTKSNLESYKDQPDMSATDGVGEIL